ncbi:Uncharacterised protein [Mycobacteroides abscessus subsp. massiliense]|nr:Uncharacterised protein [Mycobacteroides abscessus subsp. massiliense]
MFPLSPAGTALPPLYLAQPGGSTVIPWGSGTGESSLGSIPAGSMVLTTNSGPNWLFSEAMFPIFTL